MSVHGGKVLVEFPRVVNSDTVKRQRSPKEKKRRRIQISDRTPLLLCQVLPTQTQGILSGIHAYPASRNATQQNQMN